VTWFGGFRAPTAKWPALASAPPSDQFCTSNVLCSLIREIKLSSSRVCVDQPLEIRVVAKGPGGETPRVLIDGVLGAKQQIQFSSFGPRRVTVSAISERRSDARSVPITVVPCQQKFPNFFAKRSVYEPDTMEFMLRNPMDFSAQGTSYRWNFGDETVVTTTMPFASHSYLESLDATIPDPVFQTSLTIIRPGLPDVVVRKALPYANDYANSRLQGFAHPPVRPLTRYLSDGGNELGAEFTVHNLESSPIRFTRRILQRHFCDPDREPVTSSSQAYDLTIPAEGSTRVQSVLQASDLGPETCGVSIHLFADGPDGVALSSVAHFEVPRRHPLAAQRVADPQTRAYLQNLVARGLVSDPNNITQQEIQGLVLQGRASPPPASPDPPRFVRGATDDEGDVCVPGDTAPRPGLDCQPGADEWELSPAFIRNARRGDLFINGGCGPIAKLLQSIGQNYSHEAIMTQNYYRIAHSTGSKDYLSATIPKDSSALFVTRFDEKRLRYFWPGALKESVEEAFNGARYIADDGNVYSMNTFNPEPQQCEGSSDTFPILVIKPPLEEDALARPILHRAAELAEAQESHYRFFAFTQGNISMDPPANYTSRPIPPGYTNQYPLNTSFRSPVGESATVSTTFLWDVLKRAGAKLEGCQFEVGDERLNDKRGRFWTGLPYLSDTDCKPPRIGGEVDGLYWYRQDLRDVAGKAVFDATYNDVAAQIAKGGGVSVYVDNLVNIGSHAEGFAQQMLNCFAYDACGDLNGDDSTAEVPLVAGIPSPLRRVPLPFGDGVSVSPDDFLMWDAPGDGGVLGRSEVAQVRSGEYRRVHRWRAAEGTFTVTGSVMREGLPEPGATIDVGAAVTLSGVDGSFRVAGVSGGLVSVRAQKLIQGQNFTAEKLVQIDANTAPVVLDLVSESSSPPEGLVLYARRVNIVGNMRVKDDDTTDEFADLPINASCEVSPLARRAAVTPPITKCAGGEARGEALIECLLLPNNQDVQVTLITKLYEGTSCSNNDLDGTSDPSLIPRLAPGQSAPLSAKVVNGEAFSDDYASVNVTAENVQGAALDLPVLNAADRRLLRIEAFDIDVVDHETFGGNEIVRDSSLVKYCYVDPLTPNDHEHDTTACAGGEVRGALDWDCRLVPGSGGVVTVAVKLSMYEGTTCSEDVTPRETRAELVVQPCASSPCAPDSFSGPISLRASDGSNEVRVQVRAFNDLAP